MSSLIDMKPVAWRPSRTPADTSIQPAWQMDATVLPAASISLTNATIPGFPGVGGLELVERHPVLAAVRVVHPDAVAVDPGHHHRVLLGAGVGDGLAVVGLVVVPGVGLPVEGHPDQRRVPGLHRRVDRARRNAHSSLADGRAEMAGGRVDGRPVDTVARLLDLAAVGVAHEVEKGITAARLTRPVVDGVDADLVEDLLLGRRMAEEGEHHRERGLLARQVVLLVVHGHVDGDRWRARW